MNVEIAGAVDATRSDRWFAREMTYAVKRNRRRTKDCDMFFTRKDQFGTYDRKERDVMIQQDEKEGPPNEIARPTEENSMVNGRE